MAVKFSNNAGTTLSAGISSGATSFSVVSATGFPTLGGSDLTYISLTNEVVKVTAISGTTFTCVATSGAHLASATVELRMTTELLNDFAEDLEALPITGGALTGAVTTSSTFDGRDVGTDGTKLDTIESSAKDDQTGAEIKTLYEAESNAYTDTKNTKLSGIATSANNYSHPNHSGDVVSASDGAMTIQAGAVDIAMLSATGTAGATKFLRGDNVWEALSGASLSAGDTFDNPNNISTNQTNTLVSTKNYMLIGDITVSDGVTWTVDGTGEIDII